MPIVSDTSPILALSAIGHLELLRDQFGEVFIPQAVLAELKVETDFRGTDAIQLALSNGWLKSKEIQNKPLVPNPCLWNYIKGKPKRLRWQWIWVWT